MRAGNLLIQVGVLAMLAAPLRAQYPDEDGGRRGPPRRRQPTVNVPKFDLPAPGQIAGPPRPAALEALLTLSGEQTARYTARYQAYMDSTRVVRDSLDSAMVDIRGAATDQRIPALRGNGPVAQRLWKGLSESDRQFDRSLGDVLTSEQLHDYLRWRDEERKEAQRARG